MAFHLIEGDLEPDLSIAIVVNDAAEDLTDATDFEMLWKQPDGSVSTVPLTAPDPLNGLLLRTWDAGDTDQVGDHYAQIVITRGNGETQTFPSDGSYVIWTVHPRLA